MNIPPEFFLLILILLLAGVIVILYKAHMMKRILLPLLILLICIFLFFIVYFFTYSIEHALATLVASVTSAIVINSIVKKRRATNHQNSLNELKKSEEITKNGVVVNAADETEQYSVKKCPSCAEEINKDATKCKHCGERVGKGYEIIDDGIYVAKKIQGEWTSGQSSENKKSGNLFFRVVWITLTVLVVILLFEATILTTIFVSIFG